MRVSFVLASLVVLVGAEPAVEGRGVAEGGGRVGRQRQMAEGWRGADKDGDGKVSRAEFGVVVRIAQLSEEKKDAIFKRLDKDGDGQVSGEELERLVRVPEVREGRGGNKEVKEPRDGKGGSVVPPPPGGQGPPGPRDGQGPRGPRVPRLDELDTDKSGGISLEEFRAGEIFKKLPVERQAAMFRRLDSDGDGQVTPKDRPTWGRYGGGMVELRPLFEAHDGDKDGGLSPEEFGRLPWMNALPEVQRGEWFGRLDGNRDGKVDFGEFSRPEMRGFGRGEGRRGGGAPVPMPGGGPVPAGPSPGGVPMPPVPPPGG